MKKKISSLTLIAAIASVGIYGTNLQAFDDTKSLVSFEGGYSTLDIDAPSNASLTEEFGHLGLKVGAETQNYRIFLSFRYFDIEDFDYATSIGGEAQYLINFSSWMNMFVGINAGYMNMKFAPNNTEARTFSDPYYGGDVGVNLHVSKNIDLELGARVHSIQAENTMAGGTYQVNDMVSGYTSFIYKFDLE